MIILIFSKLRAFRLFFLMIFVLITHFILFIRVVLLIFFENHSAKEYYLFEFLVEIHSQKSHLAASVDYLHKNIEAWVDNSTD